MNPGCDFGTEQKNTLNKNAKFITQTDAACKRLFTEDSSFSKGYFSQTSALLDQWDYLGYESS